MKRRRTIYEGKAKILYEGPEPGTLVQYFKDDTTAFDAKKKAVLEGKWARTGMLTMPTSRSLATTARVISAALPVTMTISTSG